MSCDIIKRFIEILAETQPTLTETLALQIESQLRHEFAGERVYIPKRDERLRLQIIERFNGKNIAKLERELRISRRTIYYAIKKRRVTEG